MAIGTIFKKQDHLEKAKSGSLLVLSGLNELHLSNTERSL
jgi:hypothetical protein